jgi:hypothetical protein
VVLHSPVPAALLRANGECSGGEGAVVGGLTLAVFVLVHTVGHTVGHLVPVFR